MNRNRTVTEKKKRGRPHAKRNEVVRGKYPKRFFLSSARTAHGFTSATRIRSVPRCEERYIVAWGSGVNPPCRSGT